MTQEKPAGRRVVFNPIDPHRLSRHKRALRRRSQAWCSWAGTAFGMNHEKHRTGDILVSQQLQLYDLQRIGADQIALCGDPPHAPRD